METIKYPSSRIMNKRQAHLLTMGEFGCYFLTLSECMDFNKLYHGFVNLTAEGALDEECTVLDPVKVYNYFHDQKVASIEKIDDLSIMSSNSVKKAVSRAKKVIGCFKSDITGLLHFAKITCWIQGVDLAYYVEDDPLGNSLTIKKGYLKGLRILS